MITTEHQTTILYADDSEEDHCFFKTILSAAKVDATLKTVSSGNDVLKILFDANAPLPDLIFLDINMPFGGIQCLTEIRKKITNIPVIMYSTSDDPDDIDRSYAGGANLYVIKPWTLEESKNLIKTIFSMNWKQCQRPPKENFVLSLNR